MTKKKILLIVLPIVLVVVIGVVFAVLYFTTNIFKSTDELFWQYMSQNKDITNILENDKLASQTEFKNNNSYNSTGNLTYSTSTGENSSKYFDVETTARHDANTGRTYADATLKNGDIDLFNVSYINSGDVYAIKSADVVDNYIGIRNSGLKELAAKYNISTDKVPDTINIKDYTSFFDLTDEQKNHIYETYLPMIKNNISEDNYVKSNQDVQIDGETYNANVYAATLTGDQLKQILISSLETLKKDTETMVLISNKASVLNLGVEYTDITNLTVKINSLIEQINGLNITNNTNIYVYENYDQTIRTVIEVENMIEITYDRVNNKQILTIDYTQGSIEQILNSSTETNQDMTNTLTENNIGTNSISDGIVNDTTDTNIVVENLITDTNETEISLDQMADITVNTENVVQTDTNTIMDINTTADNITDVEDTQVQEISRLVITKETSDQNTNNNITFINNINDENENSISITYNMSSASNDSINNSYNITVTATSGSITNPIIETTTIDYITSTVRVDQVEEIQELTDSNTVIANNYDATQFSAFMEQWLGAFESILTEKMASIGIEDEDGVIVTNDNNTNVQEETTPDQ